jgi:hypothetical protein
VIENLGPKCWEYRRKSNELNLEESPLPPGKDAILVHCKNWALRKRKVTSNFKNYFLHFLLFEMT